MGAPAPSPDRFVVKAALEALPEASRRLADLGALERIEGASGLCLLRLRRPPADPKEAWRRILKGLESACWAAPLLLDERGEPLVPTGEIAVRFRSAPSDAGLEAFAASFGLRLRGRNELVPEQASFEPADPRATYLPDLLSLVSSESAVARAWASTLSRYRRT